MVVLGCLDLVGSWPEITPTEPVVGSGKVIVAFTFSGACHACVVGADGMMAACTTVCSHVSCELERALASATACTAATTVQ